MNENPVLGSVCLFPFDFELRDWKYCDGSVLPVSKYTALFTLLGAKFGGDGITTFCLPKLNDDPSLPKSLRYQICVNGRFPSRE